MSLRWKCLKQSDGGKWIGWLFGFYGISTLVGYLMLNLFYMNNQFYFKLFGLVKQFLIQTIQFCIIKDFVYTQVKCQHRVILNNSV